MTTAGGGSTYAALGGGGSASSPSPMWSAATGGACVPSSPFPARGGDGDSWRRCIRRRWPRGRRIRAGSSSDEVCGDGRGLRALTPFPVHGGGGGSWRRRVGRRRMDAPDFSFFIFIFLADNHFRSRTT